MLFLFLCLNSFDIDPLLTNILPLNSNKIIADSKDLSQLLKKNMKTSSKNGNEMFNKRNVDTVNRYLKQFDAAMTPSEVRKVSPILSYLIWSQTAQSQGVSIGPCLVQHGS